jgi:hypothetical protein
MLSWLLVIAVVLPALSTAPTGVNYKQGKASYLDAGQLHLISGSVTAQSKQDVLYSLLLAQLAANAKATRSSIAAWYENYERTLPNIAWVTTSSPTFNPFIPSTDRISLKSVITTSLVGRIGPELEDVLSRAFDRIQHLNPTDPVIEEFTKDAGDGSVYNFQVQLVDENNGALTVLQLYVTLTTSERAGSDVFLLHEYAKNAVNIQVAYEVNTLNSNLYAIIRQSVIDKLGPDRIARYINVLFDD